MRIVTIAPRSGLGHELLTNLNSAVVVFGDSEILWIQKPSHLVNATTPGPFSYLRLRGAGLLENPEYQWLAIKGSQKLPGLLWGVRDDACELYYTICACELKKKTLQPSYWCNTGWESCMSYTWYIFYMMTCFSKSKWLITGVYIDINM